MAKKTSYSYVSIAFIILVFGIIFIPKIINRLSNEDVVRDDNRSENVTTQKISTTKSDLVYIPGADGQNRKVPDFSFTSHNGKTITNKDYLGRVYVVEFFFTTCPTICPRMNRNLVQIQDEFKDLEKDFGIASFTINPEYDTEEVLKSYAENYGISNPNWHLMTGDEDVIYKLSNEGFYLNTAVNKEVEGGFEHSGNFALIDREGFIRSRVDANGNPIIYYNGIISEKMGEEDGQKEQISMLKTDIRKLLNE